MRRIAPFIGTVAVLAFAPGAVAQAAPSPAPTRPAAGKLTLSTPRLYRVGGRPVALARQTWRLVAAVSRFVPGQFVKLTFSRNGRVLKRVTVPVRRTRRGAGGAATSFRLAGAGRVRVSATHASTAAQAGMSAGGRVDVIFPSAGYGTGCQSIRDGKTGIVSSQKPAPSDVRTHAGPSRIEYVYTNEAFEGYALSGAPTPRGNSCRLRRTARRSASSCLRRRCRTMTG